MTAGHVVITGLGFAWWLIGGHILVAAHHRRMSKPWWSGFKLFGFPFNDFNAREWLLLLGLAHLGYRCGRATVTTNEP
jgi:hypothetical protein